METLSTEFRRQLERTVIEARDVAEAGARVAIEALAVQHHEPYGHMGSEQRTLRRRLRAHARQLGDRPDARSGGHGIDHLLHECAYEHWHGMLFARYLSENHLLIEPEMGVAISLDECEELAKDERIDKWTLASRFAHRMLPQVFRPDHPVFEVQFAREYRLKLEGLVEGLPADVFGATDSLGWVYQFWQTKKKDEVNRSEVKIGANELPAVTQLFTEPYMVQFLLHNSLGAWWVSRHPNKACPVDLTYLRRTEDGASAAGTFEGWPDDLSKFRLLDPCCGSGHFLVAAFLMLAPMRMALEGLDAAEAVDAVLRENIHGLELDQRCVAIAAFALALEAWRYPGAGGFRVLSRIDVAWCGQPVGGKKEQWLALAEGDFRLEAGMTALYDIFRNAPTLGSLIDPARYLSEDMLTAGFEELKPLLDTALRKHAGEEEWEEMVIAARGVAAATKILSHRYQIVVTNVPYLVQGKQAHRLRDRALKHYSIAKNDLATVFLLRCLELAKDQGIVSIVLPQNWLYQKSYRNLRKHLISQTRMHCLARLGAGAFHAIGGEVVKVVLFIVEKASPSAMTSLQEIDVSDGRGAETKSQLLKDCAIMCNLQSDYLNNPDSRIVPTHGQVFPVLSSFATALHGQSAGDNPVFNRCFWEIPRIGGKWKFYQDTPEATTPFVGRSGAVLWEHEKGRMFRLAESVKHLNHKAQQWRSGNRIGVSAVLP